MDKTDSVEHVYEADWIKVGNENEVEEVYEVRQQKWYLSCPKLY